MTFSPIVSNSGGKNVGKANSTGIGAANGPKATPQAENHFLSKQAPVDTFQSKGFGLAANGPTGPRSQFQVPGTAQRVAESVGPFNVLSALSNPTKDPGIGLF